MALKKVVLTYSEVNDHKITPIDALAISKVLLLKASDHYEYLKTTQNDEIIVEIERTERIFKYVLTLLYLMVINNNNYMNHIKWF